MAPECCHNCEDAKFIFLFLIQTDIKIAPSVQSGEFWEILKFL